MKIVIDIPEENYERMKFMEEVGAINNPYLKAIANGTPLPKGHGRLIDADKFESEHFGKVARFVDDAPTIIEADEEGAEE